MTHENDAQSDKMEVSLGAATWAAMFLIGCTACLFTINILLLVALMGRGQGC